MIVPFVDLKVQYKKIEPEINKAISSVFEGARFILGENVSKFEKEFCEYLGGGYGVSVGSGLDAIYLALLVAGVNPGDEVITVSHTFIATYLAIVKTGAKPVLIDIDPSSFNMDVNKIEEKINKKTKAILPVHLYGQPAYMSQINRLAEKHGLIVIEDACQAHGASIESKKAGLFGDLACFSFYPAKNLGAYGDGGMIVTRKKELKEKLFKMRNYGQKEKYNHDCFGINSRLDELQAAILRIKLRYLDEWNKSRRNIAAIYSHNLNSEYVVCPPEKEGFYHVYHLYVIRTPYRDKLQEWLSSKNVHTQIHYPIPVHKQKCCSFSNERVLLPITEQIVNEIISLPIYPGLEENKIQYVIDNIHSFMDRM